MRLYCLVRNATIVGVAALCAALPAGAAEIRKITLEEAVRLAISQNHVIKIARLKVEESREKKAEERSGYLPSLTNQSGVLRVTELQDIVIPAGSLGGLGGALTPPRSINLDQGKQTLITSGTTLSQPLTQLIRIRQKNRIAAADVATSREDVKNAENQISLQVHTVYYGILIAQLQKKAAEQQTDFATENLRENEEEVRDGSALKVASLGGRASLLEAQQAVLTASLQLADLMTALNDLLGLPLNTQLELDSGVPTSFETGTKTQWLSMAWAENPEILAAEETVHKAQAARAAARTAYIPDVTAFARYSYQNGVPFFVHNFGTFGVSLTYDIFDFGKRRATVRERNDEVAEAEENVARLKDGVAVSIERCYHKLERTKNMVQVAQQIVMLREESERVANNQLAQGMVKVSERRQATAANYKAQADLLQASLGYLLARAELQQAAGRTPGLQ
jgi:outer membrane protein TolC